MPAPDQTDLFADDAPAAEWPASAKRAQQPLAARMRPRNLSEVVGQTHILKPGSLLPRLVAQIGLLAALLRPARLRQNVIAEAIARETQSRFVRVNAVMSNVAELREILAAARRAPRPRRSFSSTSCTASTNRNRLLLPMSRRHGAPDRCDDAQPRILRHPRCSRAAISSGSNHSCRRDHGVRAALTDAERGLGARGVTPRTRSLRLAVLCDGDLRRALNALEVLVLGLPERARSRVRTRSLRPRTPHPLRRRRGRALRHDFRVH